MKVKGSVKYKDIAFQAQTHLSRQTVQVVGHRGKGVHVQGSAGAVLAQRHQVVVAGLARLTQPAPRVQVARHPPQLAILVDSGGIVLLQLRIAVLLLMMMMQVVVMVQLMVMMLLLLVTIVRLCGRRVGRDGALDLVELLGQRVGGELDAAQAALDQFVGLLAGQAGTVCGTNMRLLVGIITGLTLILHIVMVDR